MEDINVIKDKEIEKFTKACTLFLETLCIGDLRAYGRDLGVARPTLMKKEELVDSIIGILTGRLLPIDVSAQGAPVKNDYVDTRIPEKMELLRQSFMPTVIEQMEMRYRMERAQENKPVFFLHEPGEGDIVDLSPEKPSTEWEINPFEIYRGQAVLISDEYYIFPLNGNGEKGVVSLSVELVQKKRIKEGDILSFRAFKNRALGGCATEILTVNAYFSSVPPMRPNFDDCISFCSSERIQTYKVKRYEETSLKFIDWLQPICMGQRACLVAPPLSGKSSMLREVVEAVGALNDGMNTFALLVNQPLDVVYAYSNYIEKENLFFTTCEEDADRHVFVAEFLLKRIKRLVENGENVFLVVDSLTELARAFNETEASEGEQSLPCGLENKTLRYVKEYFNTAKYLMRGGSVTMLAAVSVGTGDPIDEVIAKELTEIANYQITFTDILVKKRISPAIDYEKCNAENMEKVRSKNEQALEQLLKGVLYQKLGNEGIVVALQESSSRREFVKKMQEIYYENV